MNITKRIANLFFITFIAFNAHPTLALGKLGHQLVCDIAYQQLNDDKKQKINQLLQTIPIQDKQLINQYNYAKKNEKITFGKACTWPDAIKKNNLYKQFSSWHYINVSRSDTTLNANSCQKNCLTQAIPLHLKQLTNTASTIEAVHALMFLGHWLGDIHQPMHVSFASDLGGNKTTIQAQGEKCDNMHWLWDDCLISRQSKHWKLEDKYQQIFPTLLQISEQKKQQWQQSDVYSWANESLTLAKAASTKYCQQHNGKCTKQSNTITFNKQELDKLSNTINIRMQQASVRLANLLTQHL